MKRLLFALFAILWASTISAQLYHPGEALEYRVSYRAKYFPNTEIGSVEVTTEEVDFQGTPHYRVVGVGRTLPTYRWFFNMEDRYTIHIDPATQRTVHFASDLQEATTPSKAPTATIGSRCRLQPAGAAANAPSRR